MRVIQQFGNFGSHFQDGAEDELSLDEIQPCLQATEVLLKWFIPDIDIESFSGKEKLLKLNLKIHRFLKIQAIEPPYVHYFTNLQKTICLNLKIQFDFEKFQNGLKSIILITPEMRLKHM